MAISASVRYDRLGALFVLPFLFALSALQVIFLSMVKAFLVTILFFLVFIMGLLLVFLYRVVLFILTYTL